MEYRNLGRTGVKVAPLALGTDNILNPTPENESKQMILRALDAGINLIDTSNSYRQGEAERVIGAALKETGRRHEVLIATKAHYPTGPGPNDRGNSRLHLLRACEDSLRRLQTDYIDLYQLHRPVFDMPIDETLSALTDLVRQGKVRYIGSSTAPAWKVLEGILVSELKGYVRFVSEQPPYNLLDRRIENELIPMAQAYNLAILPWSPLAMGMLAGRYADGELRPEGSRASLRGGIYAERVSPRAVQIGNRFVQLAREAGYDPAQLALLWVKDQPGITAPIMGPRSVEQLEHLLPVLDMTLPEDIRAACDRLVPPGSAVANFHNSAPWMKMQLEVG
ncbi:MAG: aldo/keto reductase [Meiothermus sp.]|uniref:aldo/keto reductase n=1 Tax=Meiothermus sp. TaxID=1955249 RepID=UPI0025DA7909|nr:aldo/keto reductase [Meiothermus sp.]MCS7068906.1 aldo/keto reductase [Meiothermus sp.]MCX7601577.1 aldo/keto reductase [Meiothermus sp.]MDW8426113.1 aldo/keto reductase [Meiothermus sp.]